MTETPDYTVIKKNGNLELRQYAGYIKAEVSVSGTDYKSAAEKGFNILAGYIFGNNVSRQKISMTAPVSASKSEKIAMTVPVTVSGADSYTVAFVMPSEYSLETLPVPKDERVRFIPLPSHRAAAVRFPGYFNTEKIRLNKERLGLWVEELGLETEGDFLVAGYNPPWVPGFLGRNEVMIRIKTAGDGLETGAI